MKDWNPDLYMSFEKQRTRPAEDLASSIRACKPECIVDLGCGPGNSTAVLREVFPHAAIIGIDSSQEMIDKARRQHPDIDFKVCDVRALDGEYDIIFSNACLQWLPEHEILIPSLMEHLTQGGVLAVQMPRNNDEPLYAMIDEMVKDPEWGLSDIEEPISRTLSSTDYFRILSHCSSRFDIWETKYLHIMPDHESLINWVRSTKLRPYLDALGEERSRVFLSELLAEVKDAYPVQDRGSVIMGFNRLFFTAWSK